jgi:5-methylcytosine-specific restriction enzyme A
MPKAPPRFSFGNSGPRRSWDHRKSRHERGYGTAWEKLRKRILARDRHLCQACLPKRVTAANEVDHIVPKAKGGTDDESNLRAICTPCHRAKTAADQGKKPRHRPRIGLDGWPIEEN